MTGRRIIAKGAVDGLARRRIVVTGYVTNGRPLIDIRLQQAGGQSIGRDALMDMNPRQASALVRLLWDVVQATSAETRRDGHSPSVADRASAGTSAADVEPLAE